MSAPARYATAPTPGASHELHHVETMARVLGTPLMPWQSQVARVATERREDGKGWRYPTIVLTVPRQSGKTALMRAVMAQRTLRYPRSQAFYTAQSGKDARERWADLVNVADERFPQLVRIKRGAGVECMEWLNGHGQVRTFAPTRTALHGYTPELVMLDEAFAYDEDLGAALMAAIVPSQSTLDERQLWIVSTAGDGSSTWFRQWVDRGREAVTDPDSTLAFFDWNSEGLDLTDPASFPKYHPAVGYTQTAATLIDARENMSPGEYARAFGNVWTTTRRTVIPAETMTATTNKAQTPPASPSETVYAFEIAPDRAWATIWACWADHVGTHLRPYISKPGSAWITDEVTRLVHDGIRVAADNAGANRGAIGVLALDGIHVETTTATDFAAATGDLIAALDARTVDHNGSSALLTAVDGAMLRRLGEADAWSRRDSTGPIWELAAATVAFHAHKLTRQAPAPFVLGT